MKRSLFLLALLPAALSVHADELTLGYCTDRAWNANEGLRPSSVTGEFTMNAAVWFPQEILSKYPGAQITAVHYHMVDTRGDFMTLRIADGLDSAWPLYNRIITSWTPGWNSLTLPTPVTITGESGLAVLYLIHSMGDEIPQVMVDAGSVLQEGCNWYGMNSDWFEMRSPITSNVSIRMTIEGDGFPQTDGGVRHFSVGDGNLYQNEPTTATFLLRNYGVQTITDIDADLTINGVTERRHVSGLSVSPWTEQQVSIADVVLPHEGNNSLSLRLVNVNGASDSDAADNFDSAEAYALPEPAAARVRNVVFEEFCSEYYWPQVEASLAYADIVGHYRNVFTISHHLDEDNYSCPGDVYTWLFDNGQDFCPAVMMDRTHFTGLYEYGPVYFITDLDYFEQMVNVCLAQPAYAELDVTPVYDPATRELQAIVDCESDAAELPLQTDLRMTLYLIEDALHSTTQRAEGVGNYLPDYVQNGVVRAILTDGGAQGESVSLDAHSFSSTYTITLDDSWRPASMRLVAVLHNYDASNYGYNAVYNSAQCRLSAAAGVAPIDASSPGARTAAPVIYDLSGTRRTALQPGVNIVDGRKVIK